MEEQEDDEWWHTFNGVFWLTMSASLFAFFVAVLNALIKSRCKSYSCCCGVFTAERNYEDDVIETDGQPPIINNVSNVDLENYSDAV